MTHPAPLSHTAYLALHLHDWFPAAKRAYPVQAKMVSAPTPVYNFLEDTHYTARSDTDVVLLGSLGEEWVSALEHVCRTYTLPDGAPITPGDFTPRDRFITLITRPAMRYFACFIPLRYRVEVPLCGGGVLHANRDGVDHGAGDFLVCAAGADGGPEPSRVWVVNGRQFAANYEPREQDI